jgi:hypothetical protein
MKHPSKQQKITILDAFLEEVRRISVEQIERGVDAGDPLAQVRAACNVLETAFEEQQGDHITGN